MQSIPANHTPYLLQLWQWISNPLAYLENCYREYGDIFTANLFGYRTVVISNPHTLQEVLTNDTKQYAAPGDPNKILEPFIGERGVILLNGSEHRQRRQLLMPQFHGDKIRVYADVISKATQAAIASWQVGEIINVRAQTQAISIEVILLAVFGLSGSDRYAPICDRLTRVGALIESPLNASFVLVPTFQKDLGAWSPWGKFVRDRAELDRLLYAEIAERRRNYQPDRSDILTLLIGARDADGNGMSDTELRDELMTLLSAGHETTATAIAWAIYWVHYLPEVKKKLLAEISSIGTERDPMVISKLPYLNAFCAETLRIYPVAMLTFPRMTRETVTLQGHALDPGTVISGAIYLTHRREDIYPEPHLFKPERFLDRQFSPYEHMPFGGGSRRCIGAALAQLELKLALVEILTNTQLELVSKSPAVPARRGITLAPKGGIEMKVVAVDRSV